MKSRIDKTIVIEMTVKEAEKISHSLREMIASAETGKLPADWAKKDTDQLYEFIVNAIQDNRC